MLAYGKFWILLPLAAVLVACGGGGKKDKVDNHFADVRGYYQQDGVWRIDGEITLDKEQVVSSGAVSVTGTIQSNINLVTQMVVDYTDDDHIRFRYCDTDPDEIKALNEIEDEQYFSGDEDFGDFCESETHKYVAIDENQFRVEVSCGSNLTATMTATRVSDIAAFDAGSFRFTTTDENYSDLDANSGVCGQIMRIHATVSFPQPNALELSDQDISLTDVMVGVDDYMGQRMVFEMTFPGDVEAGSYTVVGGDEEPSVGQVGELQMELGSTNSLFGSGGNTVTVNEVGTYSISANFDVNLAQPGLVMPVNFIGSFSFDLQ